MELLETVKQMGLENNQKGLRQVYENIQLKKYPELSHEELAKIKLFIIDWFDR
jgi:hypothetical protein